MFKKKKHDITNVWLSIERNINEIKGRLLGLSTQQRIIESQQRTIEHLTNALQDKYEHGLFVVGEEGKLPVVIKNGKVLTDENTLNVNVCWERGSVPYITIDQ